MDRMTLLKRLDSALTYDSVAERVEDPADLVDLGMIMHYVRKLFREAVEMTDEEFEELSQITAEDMLRWAENGKVD